MIGRKKKEKKPKGPIGTVVSLGFQVGAAVTAARTLKDARRGGDKLEIFDAVTHAAVIASGIALLVRGLRQGKAKAEAHESESGELEAAADAA